MNDRPGTGWWAGCAMLLVLAACEGDKPQPTAASTASGGAAKASAAPSTTSSAAAPDAPKGAVREGEWKVNAPGRGVAYEVSSKGGVVQLSFGGTVLEGKPADGGRRYAGKSGKEYVFKPLGNGFELLTEGKPTWKVELADDGVTISSGDKQMSIAKAGDILAITNGDDVIGKVEVEGKTVKVTDGSGATKYEGEDALLAAWGVLLLRDIGQPMQRLIFTELLARGR